MAACSGVVPDTIDDLPLLHATDQPGANSLRVDSTTLHWVNEVSGSIMACDLATGETRTLVSDIDGISTAFAVSESHVYWATWIEGAVMRVSRHGGEPEEINNEGLSRATDMVVVGGDLFLAIFGGAIFRIPADGGPAEDLHWPEEPWTAPPTGLEAQDNYLYVGSKNAIRRMRIDSLEWETITDDPRIGSLSGLTVNARFVYGSSINDDRLFRVPVSGGELTILSEDQQFLQILADDSRLFFSTQYGVGYMPADGGEQVQLAPPGQLPEEFMRTHTFALGSRRVWWATREYSEPNLQSEIWSLQQPDL